MDDSSQNNDEQEEKKEATQVDRYLSKLKQGMLF